MPFTVEPLTSENMPLWLDFFDNRALKDNDDWDGCYCQHDLNTQEIEDQVVASGVPYPEEFRKFACKRAEEKLMQGYLAIENGAAIGWLSAGPGINYIRWPKCDEKTARIICFTVQADARGKGVMRALLDYALTDLTARGFNRIEARGISEEVKDERNFRGPIKLYREYGFEVAEKIDEVASLVVKTV